MRQLNWWRSLLIILLFSMNTSAHLKKLDYDSQNPFNLSEGLSVCAMESMFPFLLPQPHSMEVLSIKADVCLCSAKSNVSLYELCLQVQLELSITNDSFPGSDDDDDDTGEYPEEETSTAGGKEVEPPTTIETSEEPASLNLCYTISQGLSRCYKVACAVHSSREHPRQTEWFGVLLKPEGLTPGSIVHVTAHSITTEVTTTIPVPIKVPSCTASRRKDCVDPPELLADVDMEKGEVVIKVKGKTDQVNMCVKSERTGICKPIPTFPIPLHSVTPCTCFQAWGKNKIGGRSESCLFRNTEKLPVDVRKVLRQNVLDNVTVSVVLSRTHSSILALSWNVSVPCQEEVNVSLCHLGPGRTCRDVESGSREGGDVWIHNDNGSWRKFGSFLDVRPHPPLCVRMKVMGEEFGPLCPKHAGRWHWSIPIMGVLLFFTLIIFGLYLKRTTLEKWIQKWQGTSLLQGGHVLLLHPPCEDASLSEQVCVLGSTLRSLGFTVSLDLWSLMEQAALGPVPWLHAQMELLRSTGGRALVVLSRTALERAEEWTWQGWAGPRAGRFGDRDSDGDAAPPSPALPPADAFAAALGCLLEDHQRGGASRLFSLVQFDSHCPFAPGGGDPGLPLLFRGLSLYSLPAESQPFLDSLMELGGVTARPRGRWQSKWLSRTLRESQQGTSTITRECSPQISNSGETVPLKP